MVATILLMSPEVASLHSTSRASKIVCVAFSILNTLISLTLSHSLSLSLSLSLYPYAVNI
jgi:hypothetical protein